MPRESNAESFHLSWEKKILCESESSSFPREFFLFPSPRSIPPAGNVFSRQQASHANTELEIEMWCGEEKREEEKKAETREQTTLEQRERFL